MKSNDSVIYFSRKKHKPQVMQLIKNIMKIHNQQHKLSEVVNEGLTPLMQVPVVDKIFSSAIKERYDHYQPKSPNNIGKKV